MSKTRKILFIVLGIPAACILLAVGLVIYAVMGGSNPQVDYDDPESLWLLAERTERYIMLANPGKDSTARKEALQALEDIALLDVSEDEKARLIRERFPEESFWTDDLKNVLKQAEAGDAEAQFQLGCFYSWRRNVFASDADLARAGCVMKSYAMAFKWFRKAAMQGHAKAQYQLGKCYKNGEGVEKDRVKAFLYFTKSAKQDNANAQLALGKCYLKGKGVASDRAKATMWLKKAVKNEKGGKEILQELREEAALGDEDAKLILSLVK